MFNFFGELLGYSMNETQNARSAVMALTVQAISKIQYGEQGQLDPGMTEVESALGTEAKTTTEPTKAGEKTALAYAWSW